MRPGPAGRSPPGRGRPASRPGRQRFRCRSRRRPRRGHSRRRPTPSAGRSRPGLVALGQTAVERVAGGDAVDGVAVDPGQLGQGLDGLALGDGHAGHGAGGRAGEGAGAVLGQREGGVDGLGEGRSPGGRRGQRLGGRGVVPAGHGPCGCSGGDHQDRRCGGQPASPAGSPPAHWAGSLVTVAAVTVPVPPLEAVVSSRTETLSPTARSAALPATALRTSVDPVSWTFNSPARVDTVSTLPLRAVMAPCTDGPPPGPWAWPPWVWPPWPAPGNPWPPPGPCRLPRGSLPSWASWNASARVAGPDDAVARPRKKPPAAPTTRQSTPATSRSRHGERPPPRSYTGTPVASGLVGFCCTACSSRSDGVVVRRRPLADRRPAPGAAGHDWPPPGRG